jgi:hypothetical protein
MRNASDKSCRETKTHVSCSVTFFSENRSFYEIMWKNTVQSDRQQMKILFMRIACWIPKATHTHTHTHTLSLSLSLSLFLSLSLSLRIYNTYCFFTATMVTLTPTLPVLVDTPSGALEVSVLLADGAALLWVTCVRPSETTILFSRNSEHESPTWRDAFSHKKEGLIQRRHSSDITVLMLQLAVKVNIKFRHDVGYHFPFTTITRNALLNTLDITTQFLSLFTYLTLSLPN